MTDRELLELAAKAAGVKWVDPCFDYDDFGRMMLDFGHGVMEWNPLVNDGDALRLAVSLGIDLLFTPEDVEAFAAQHAYEDHQEMITPWAWEGITEKDPYAATRRAIVRAAAEVGKQMGGSDE